MIRNSSETTELQDLMVETRHKSPKPISDTKIHRKQQNRVRTQIQDFVFGVCIHCFGFFCLIPDCFRMDLALLEDRG